MLRAILTFVLIVMLLVVIELYLAQSLILGKLSEKAISFAIDRVKIANVEYTRPTFKFVRFTSFNAVTWYGISTNVTMVRNEALGKVESIFVKIQQVTITLENPFKRVFKVSVRGISAVSGQKKKIVSSDSSLSPPDRIDAGDFKFQVTFDALKTPHIRAQIVFLSNELKKFSQTGATKIPVEFSANETFVIRGKTYTAKIWVEKKGGEYRLVMDEDSLMKVGNSLGGITPTKGDMTLLAKNPIKAPQMLRIRDKSSYESEIAHKNDPNVPEDAYRHVLWAYLLTKAYGEEFAKEVGDAHESEADIEEIQIKGSKYLVAARNQDFNNNAVGRNYAKLGYEESSILRRVMTDPAVILDKDIMN